MTETSSRIVKILSNRDVKIQSFPQEDKKSGKRYTIRQTVNAYTHFESFERTHAPENYSDRV